MAIQHLNPTPRASGNNRPFCRLCRLLLPLLAMMTGFVWSQLSSAADAASQASVAATSNVPLTYVNGVSVSDDLSCWNLSFDDCHAGGIHIHLKQHSTSQQSPKQHHPGDNSSNQDYPEHDGTRKNLPIHGPASDSCPEESQPSVLSWRKLAPDTEDSCHRFEFEMPGLIWLDQLKYASALLNLVALPKPDVSQLQRRQAAASMLGFELTGSLISSHVRLQI
jgi:hypothetical protein